ncbi:uncharacterized protein MELLADRAFT_71536 [Melampsora larici-populina 98AG31]|uniref:Uncharacterized protein n=1 Tax=Melampsora larici-populina (strain 98AG31 / pathotype 3-4-7) TaxID=747676 RepID=F4RHE3_MELLP|nr:uncharacterized protein MELLADRAFT_71536 [Melampsora larici-populina 98AG31]EGG08248.1 hypothetical protein MELLADRAFT_71536 [Melampsora larici-populina 98AG31]
MTQSLHSSVCSDDSRSTCSSSGPLSTTSSEGRSRLHIHYTRDTLLALQASSPGKYCPKARAAHGRGEISVEQSTTSEPSTGGVFHASSTARTAPTCAALTSSATSARFLDIKA